jgi:hypothetical protein
MISRQPIFTLTPYLLSGGAAHINCIVEQELPTIPEHLSLSLILSGVHVAQSFDGIIFEDTKGVIRIRISKKNRQHNGQKKKDKRTNNDL